MSFILILLRDHIQLWALVHFALGQEFAKFDTVEKFIPLEGVGHCPQDEAPELVNLILLEFISEISQRHR